MAFITNIESPYRCAIMEDWNWALGYGIGKDVETGKDVFVHHSFLEESVIERGACTGFSWINDKGEKISGESVRILNGWSEETAYTIQRSLSTLT